MTTIATLLDLPGDVDAEQLRRCETLLDADETRRLGTFQRESSRRQFMVVHALARVMLSQLLPGVAPNEWHFKRGEFGKPQVVNGGVWVNWSHTDGMVAAVVSTEGDVGIDVEQWDRPVDLNAMAKALTPAEQARLAMLNEPQRRRAFFELWTAREAYAKRIGRGVAMDFRTIAIEGQPGDERIHGEDGECRLTRFDAPPTHLVAVATASENAHFQRLTLAGLLALTTVG